MEREIIFRGKRLDNGEWVYGYIDATMYQDIVVIHSEASTHGVDPETVGQYTGLKDKNGIEVFEGDLLRIPAKDSFEKDNYVSFEVFWHDNDCADRHIGWQLNRLHFHGSLCGYDNPYTFLPKYVSKMIVIGNIHEKL